MVTVITKTIGAGGGYDYANFTTAEAAVESIATTAFGSTDLVANDGAIVFEAVAGTYTENVTHTSTLVTDATRNVTYRAAAGSEHGGIATAGVIRNGYINHSDTESYTVFQGLVFNIGSGVGDPCMDLGGDGVAVRDCIFISQGARGLVRCGLIHQCGQGDPAEFTNCVFDSTATVSRACIETVGRTGGTFTNIINCTGTAHTGKPFIESTNSPVTTQILNCLVLGNRSYTETIAATLTGSNNFGGSTDPFPASIQGTPYPITATTSFSTPLGSGDYAVYMGATGALANVTGNDVWQQGVGPASNPDVPTTDINGVTRSGTSCNPGAFEADGFVAPTVITKTIGAAGPPTYDYASFTLAENAVTSIGTGTDLTFYNEAIVFEAVAGTYLESVNFSSSLTTDATRQVTYKPAAGSEHGGVFGGGVVLTATGGADHQLQDDYMTIDGLEFTAAGVIGSVLNVQPSTTGVRVNQSLISNPSYLGVRINEDVSAFSLSNCVFSTPSLESIYLLESSGTTTFSVINCTFLRSPAFATGKRAVFMSASGTASVLAEFVNCLALEVDRVMAYSGVTLTGSNNFGGSASPFPPALQGTPATITATTDVDPGPGDWAIYDAATGALIDDPDNDVLAGGIGPDANPDVPTTDILGNTRSGATTDPGAFEISTLAPPEPALITIMRQIYQQDASFSVGASSAGVEKITHQLGPGSADFFTINSSTSATVSVPRTAHALRVICVVAAKACDVTLDLDASNSVFLGSIGGVASVQTDLTYFWSFGQVVSDGTYPRVRIVNDGFAGDQNVYLWWHLA